ncbi:MAG: hypothetical protein QW514_02670 [Thermoprotei archaeon]
MNTLEQAFRKIVERITFFVSVAQTNNSAISLEDLLGLMPTGQVKNVSELEHIIKEFLSGSICTDGGYAFRCGASDLVEKTRLTKLESAEKIRQTKSFVELHMKLFENTLIVAIAGSTSYGSANKNDDVDIFLVAKNGSLWSTLFKILIYIRVRRLLRIGRESIPNLCFSVVYTKRGFEELLRGKPDPLTARELINLKPIIGEEELGWYLTHTAWIRDYYPRFNPTQDSKSPSNASSAQLADTLLGQLVGGYLNMVGKFRNTLFRLQGRMQDVFRVIYSRDGLVYESQRYVKLRARYREFFKANR